MPEHLAEPGRKAWADAIAMLEQRGQLASTDFGAIALYAEAVDDWASVRAAWEKDGRPQTTRGGATGSAVVIHPLRVELRRAREHVAKLGQAIFADPSSRARARQDDGQVALPGMDDATFAPAPSQRLRRAGA